MPLSEKTKKNKIELSKNRYIVSIEFSFNPFDLDQFYYENKSYDVSTLLDEYKIQTGHDWVHLFNSLIERIFEGQKINELFFEGLYTVDYFSLVKSYFDSSTKIEKKQFKLFIKYCISKYVLKKMLKTILVYSEYRGEFARKPIDNKSKWTFCFGNFDSLLEKICNDDSHRVFKIKQAIIMFVSDFLTSSNSNYSFEGVNYPIKEDDNDLKDQLKIKVKYSIGEYQSNISVSNSFKSEYLKSVHYSPSAMVKPSFRVSSKLGIFSTANMSSGEQHLFNTINTIVYHLRNISSVTKSSKIHKYRSVNIIMDEVELYYHPEYQRTFINSLLNYIKSFSFDGVDNLNVIFSTHSPFILSDIPSCNILRLKDGNPQDDENQTFGANVHDLLANDFFLKDGFMGEYAKGQINDLINFLTYNDTEPINSKNQKCHKTWEETESQKFIELIGENILRNSLMELHHKKFKKKHIKNCWTIITLKKNDAT